MLGSFFLISYAEEVEEYEIEYEIEVETVAENLTIPWSIDFAPDGRIFFTERIGNVRIIENGELIEEPALTLKVERREGGALGLALDPNFDENHYVYLYYTKKTGFLPKDLFSETFNRLSRFTESNNKLSDEKILIDKIPGSTTHDGGRIRFGPDGNLYVTTGEIKIPELSQDINSLGGKILRIHPDGSIPDDNPFGDSLVYSYGHRNPQGLDWDKTTGKLVSSEHGPTGQDEINVVESGKNYGWPLVSGDMTNSSFVSPLYQTGPELTWAPSGASFYNSEKFSDWTGKFFVATLAGKHLRMLELDLEENKLLSSQALLQGTFGRLRDVVEGPDGNLYLLTSNQDGRGAPTPNDDRILKITSVTKIMKILGNASLSPLKQIQQGVLPEDVLCKEGFELLLKSNSGMPACVTPKTAEKLISRGWGIRID